jgi:hypothetical protein
LGGRDIPDQISLGGLLEGHDGRRLESEVGLEVLGDLADKTLESGGKEYMQRLSWRSMWQCEAGGRDTYGSLRMRSSVDFWYRRISRRATVPGLNTSGGTCEKKLSRDVYT